MNALRRALQHAYDDAQRERACTSLGHSGRSEAEPCMNGDVNYIVLRCDTCQRPNGMRLVRKNKSYTNPTTKEIHAS